jgi:hypothetical protein
VGLAAAGVASLALGAAALGVRPRLERDEIWSIAIYEGNGPFDVAPRPGATGPDLTAADVTDRAAVSVADPFLLRADGQWHLFFEIVTQAATDRGSIGLATSSDGARFSYRGVVLDEPFHLSYPTVFEWQGERYMVPESAAAGEVRLYRATRFPERWHLEATLLRTPRPADPTLFHHDGRWWLFLESSPRRHDTLRLFSAEQLEGPYQEHPESPVARGASRSRPGGPVLLLDGRLFRIAQDCEPVYGSAVRVFEILELTAERYREREIEKSPVLRGSGSGWNGLGMHTLDPHRVSEGRWLAAVDGQRSGWRIGLRWR